MTSALLKLPQLLSSGEGASFQFANFMFTEKVNEQSTHDDWVMHEIQGHADDGAPLHSHSWYETFYILEGELEVQVGNRKAIATPGTLMHVPENVAHSFRICTSTARMLEIIPASAAAFYREAGEQAPILPEYIETFLAVCAKYKVRLF